MTLYRIGERRPSVSIDAHVAHEAAVAGDVHVASRAGVWPLAAIRGDNEPIRIGEGSNVQESAVLHADPGFPLTVGIGLTVGHQAMLHGCTVGDGSLIGIQAVVLNGAVIGRRCLVAAGAVVTERKVFPDGSLIVGAPATVKRALAEDELKRLDISAHDHVQKSVRYANDLRVMDRAGA